MVIRIANMAGHVGGADQDSTPWYAVLKELRQIVDDPLGASNWILDGREAWITEGQLSSLQSADHTIVFSGQDGTVDVGAHSVFFGLPESPGFFPQMIRALIATPDVVTIFALPGSYPIRREAGAAPVPLCRSPGHTGRAGNTRNRLVFYDRGDAHNYITGVCDCDGSGYWVASENGFPPLVRAPADVILVHELGHVFRAYDRVLADGTRVPALPNGDTSEQRTANEIAVIREIENPYRALRGLPARSTDPESFDLITCRRLPLKSMEGSGGLWMYEETWKDPVAGKLEAIEAGRLSIESGTYVPPMGAFFARIEYKSPEGNAQTHTAPEQYGTPYAQYPSLRLAQQRPWFQGMVEWVQSRVESAGWTFLAPTELNFNLRPPGAGAGCMIAESFPTGPQANMLNELRVVRRDLVQRTRWGEGFLSLFHKHYYGFGEDVARALGSDPEMRRVIGIGLAQPLINYLRLVAIAPRLDPATVATLPAPWRPLVLRFAEDLREWVADSGLGQFAATNGEPESVCLEIALALRLRCLDQADRDAYLDQLGRRALIPIKLVGPEVDRLRSVMAELGATDSEISRCVVAASL